MVAYLVLFGLAFLVSLCLTPPVRSVARWAGVLDVPGGRRKLHSRSIPRLGGVAVFLSFYSCVWLAFGHLEWQGVDEASQLASAMFFPSLVVLLLGIADDLWSVGPWVKIGVQLAAGLLTYYHLNIGIETVANPFAGSSALGIFSLPATLIWIVLVTNAFNIVDGMDGLAAGVAFIALSCMFLVALEMERAPIAMVVAPLAGAVLGFLKYNFNPASVFLGDSGSLFLGFQLAVLSIVGSQKSSTAISIAAPLFILALPLVETATSAGRRFLAGRSILKPDSGHIHHQLIRLGFTPRRAAVMLYFSSAAFGLASLFVIQSGAAIIGVIALCFAAVTWVGIQRLGYTEFAEVNSALRRFVHQRRIIQNNIISRRLADDFRTAQSVAEAWRLLRSAARQLGFSYVELTVGPQNGEAADDPKAGRYARRFSPFAQGTSASETSFAVALTGARGVLGEVIFNRSPAAPPLHSELPLLIGAVANSLPRVLENSSPTALASRRQEHDKPEIDARNPAPTRCGYLMCPSCGSSDIHRSRSRSRVERVRKNLTAKRLHECGVCGWRGWMVPLRRAREDQAGVLACEPPDLQAIDLAFARVRYISATDPSLLLRLDLRQAAGPAAHATNAGIYTQTVRESHSRQELLN